MSVLNFKYVVFSFSFIHSPVGSDYTILMLTRQDAYCLIFGKI